MSTWEATGAQGIIVALRLVFLKIPEDNLIISYRGVYVSISKGFLFFNWRWHVGHPKINASEIVVVIIVMKILRSDH